MASNRKPHRATDVQPNKEDFLTAQQYLDFIKKSTGSVLEDVTELSSGKEYISILNATFPGIINMGNAHMGNHLSGLQRKENFMLLENALHDLGIVRARQVEYLAKNSSEVHIYFLHWFKKFIEINKNRKETAPSHLLEKDRDEPLRRWMPDVHDSSEDMTTDDDEYEQRTDKTPVVILMSSSLSSLSVDSDGDSDVIDDQTEKLSIVKLKPKSRTSEADRQSLEKAMRGVIKQTSDMEKQFYGEKSEATPAYNSTHRKNEVVWDSESKGVRKMRQTMGENKEKINEALLDFERARKEEEQALHKVQNLQELLNRKNACFRWCSLKKKKQLKQALKDLDEKSTAVNEAERSLEITSSEFHSEFDLDSHGETEI